MILSKDDFMKAVKERIGDDNSDEAIAFLENMSDTYNDMETKSQNDGEDWKTKFEENDRTWRDKYTKRFYEGSDSDNNIGDNNNTDSPKTFDDLFKKE